MPAWTPISKNDLSEWLLKQLNNNKSLYVECPHDFQYVIDHDHKNFISEDSSEKLKTILEKSGFYHLEIGFSPSLDKDLDVNNLSSSKIETINAYDQWMVNLFSEFKSEILLAPDTNFIKRQLYSNFFTPDRGHSLVIPRLVVLEIENRYNINNGKINPKNPEIEQAKQEVRVSYQDIVEIMKIKENGGKVFPYVDINLIKTFPEAIGRKLPDPWIRIEVIKYDEGLKRRPHTKKRCIFLSCDLMNSLAANAEGLNTLYFYTTNRIRYNQSLISNLLVNTAISYEDCSIYERNGQKLCELKGIWPGKNPIDWKNEVLWFSTPT